jgi:hypothetical protein
MPVVGASLSVEVGSHAGLRSATTGRPGPAQSYIPARQGPPVLVVVPVTVDKSTARDRVVTRPGDNSQNGVSPKPVVLMNAPG